MRRCNAGRLALSLPPHRGLLHFPSHAPLLSHAPPSASHQVWQRYKEVRDRPAEPPQHAIHSSARSPDRRFTAKVLLWLAASLAASGRHYFWEATFAHLHVRAEGFAHVRQPHSCEMRNLWTGGEIVPSLPHLPDPRHPT
jgi:hypothetical protein